MATNLTAWSPEIKSDIIGVPIQAIKLAVRNACIEFCERTLLWTYELTPISIVALTQDYTLSIPVALYAEIICTDFVKYKADGADDDQYVDLPPLSENQSDLGGDVGSSDAWKYETASAPTRHWMDIIDKQVHLWPIPTVASTSGLLVKTCLKPNDTTDTVPDFLRRDYRKTIQKGALGYLFERKATPWYDMNEAMKNNNEFISLCNNSMRKKIQGATKRQTSVQMREFI